MPARDGNAANSDACKIPLYVSYPINSSMELTLAPHREVVRGIVYTTDEISNSIVLKKPLSHTTISFEVTIINASTVLEKKPYQIRAIKGKKTDVATAVQGSVSDGAAIETDRTVEGNNVSDNACDDSALPLPVVSRKGLEERERRAIRLAEESFRHINQKASVEGQAVFSRLLKACNEVVWRGESILVLNQIRVDPPYSKEDCKLISGGSGNGAGGGSLNDNSLDRVKMIVAAASERSSD